MRTDSIDEFSARVDGIYSETMKKFAPIVDAVIGGHEDTLNQSQSEKVEENTR